MSPFAARCARVLIDACIDASAVARACTVVQVSAMHSSPDNVRASMSNDRAESVHVALLTHRPLAQQINDGVGFASVLRTMADQIRTMAVGAVHAVRSAD